LKVWDLIRRVRGEVGDPLEPFLANKVSTGQNVVFDLPKNHIERTTFELISSQNGVMSPLNPGVDYTIDYALGSITMVNAPPLGTSLIAKGDAFAMMDNDELSIHLRDAVNWHTYNQKMTERYRDRHGFITYRDAAINLDNLPAIEEPLVVMLAEINYFWALANDTATDIDIQTGEGTIINRAARHESVMRQIEALEERYARMSLILNVGPYRIEVGNLRRISQTTGRLVPLFKAREYDDHRYPIRLLPPIDSQYEDASGVPGQFWYGGGG
jgi:hypothetical protein